MSLILIIVVILLVFGGGGGYYGYSRWGTNGLGGVLGLVLIIILIVWLLVAHGVLITASYAAQAQIGFFAQLVSFAKEWEDLPAAMVAFGAVTPVGS